MTFGIDIGGRGARIATDHVVLDFGAGEISPSTRLADIVGRTGDRVPLVYQDETGDVRSRPARELFVELVRSCLSSLEDHPSVDGSDLGRGAIVLPGWWSRRVIDVVRRKLGEAGLVEHGVVIDAVAAVKGCAAEVAAVPPVLAVLDIGSHTCSVSVLQSCDHDEPELLGTPTVLFDSGGARVDALVLHHVLRGLDPSAPVLSPADPETVQAVTLLRDRCRDAKEALSAETAATISIQLPGYESRIRLVRSELDELIRPWAQDAVTLVRESLEAAPVDVDAVLLVGGAARAPLLAQMISAELGLPVTMCAEPELTTVRGAVLCAATDSMETPRRGLMSRVRLRRAAKRRRDEERAAVAATAFAESGGSEDAEPVEEKAAHEVSG